MNGANACKNPSECCFPVKVAASHSLFLGFMPVAKKGSFHSLDDQTCNREEGRIDKTLMVEPTGKTKLRDGQKTQIANCANMSIN